MQDDYERYASDRLAGSFSEMGSWSLVHQRLWNLKTLDVGCSDGLYLRTLSHDSVGIEQIPQLAAIAQDSGRSVMQGDVESVVQTIESETFDAVLASHVLEHVTRPLDLLEQLARILRSGGLLVLGLPTERNVFRNLLRMDYYAGTHLYSFSTRNIEVLLCRVGLAPEPAVVYHLPKLRGETGTLAHRAWNAPRRFPGREFLSLAYWMFARKPGE
jgi:SAM-dependent methyltransferase